MLVRTMDAVTVSDFLKADWSTNALTARSKTCTENMVAKIRIVGISQYHVRNDKGPGAAGYYHRMVPAIVRHEV